MPDDRWAAAPLFLPALPGPLSLTPVRARHLDLARLGGPPGQADQAVATALSEHPSGRAAAPGVLVHEITSEGHRLRGVVGLLTITPPTSDAAAADRRHAALLPHEGAIADRATRLAARMSELGIDPAPLLLLHQPVDPEQSRLADLIDPLVEAPPTVDGLDGRGRRHRWWTVTDEAGLAEVHRSVAGAQLLIADGHHRFAAHLELARQRPRRGDGRALVMVVDAERDSPVLAPIHRVLSPTSVSTVARRLTEAGARVETGAAGEPPAGDDPNLVLVEDGVQAVRVRLGPRAGLTVVETVHRALEDTFDGTGASTWRTHHEADQARAAVRRGPHRVALILPAPTPEEIWTAARQGRPLPAKATSFRPKPPLGLVFRSWHDG